MPWRWYGRRRQIIRGASPNAAHRALVRLARHSREFLLVTQNVDDLHERAGLAQKQLVHIHGRIFIDRCINGDYERARRSSPQGLPRCPRCGGLLRPGVVWFDEDLNAQDVKRVEDFIARPCDLVLVVGTTATFPYIVDWAKRAARRHGTLVEINPRPSRLSRHAALSLRGRAADVLPPLVAKLRRANS